MVAEVSIVHTTLSIASFTAISAPLTQACPRMLPACLTQQKTEFERGVRVGLPCPSSPLAHSSRRSRLPHQMR